MLKYWLWLAELPGLKNQSRLALLRHFGTPEEIFFADRTELLLAEDVSEEQAKLALNRDLSAAERILADCGRLGLRVLTIQDAEYPRRLQSIYDPPCLLYPEMHPLRRCLRPPAGPGAGRVRGRGGDGPCQGGGRRRHGGRSPGGRNCGGRDGQRPGRLLPLREPGAL